MLCGLNFGLILETVFFFFLTLTQLGGLGQPSGTVSQCFEHFSCADKCSQRRFVAL